jgi:hypothetical protein
MAQQKPPAESKIPPIIIRDASKWPSISSGVQARRIAFTKAKPCVDDIRVNPGTSDDFRALTLLLEEWNVPFHSFALPEAKTHRAVLRTVPVEIGLDDAQSDLVDQGLDPIKVSRMTSTRTKKPLPLVLVEVPKDKAQIFQLKTVCHLLISVERPHKKGTPSQCHKCQRFHHSKRHCHAQPKCVKCGESHESRACQKTRDAAAKCANCGGPHTASYRGCPRFPREYVGRKTPRETPQNPPKNRGCNCNQEACDPNPLNGPPKTKSRDQKSRLRLVGRDSIVELHRGDPQEGARDHPQSSLKLLNASAREG